MKTIEVVCSDCAKQIIDGRFVEQDSGELVCNGCVEAAYQVYLAATDKDVNETLFRMLNLN
jgi:hypothetical protein